MFGELIENNLTRRRNDLLKKVRSLATVTCGCAYPGPGQQAVASCAFSKTVATSQFIPTRARTFLLARIQSNFPSHCFPCMSAMMVMLNCIIPTAGRYSSC